MKTKLTLLLLLCAYITQAQTIDRWVTGSTGDHYDGDNFSLYWTVGEPTVETIANLNETNTILTQGFHQELGNMPVAIDEVLAESYGIQVFPNPAMEYLNIKVTSTKPVRAVLSTTLGQHIWQRNINSTLQVSTATLSESVYFLHCYTDEGEWIGTYKIVRQ